MAARSGYLYRRPSGIYVVRICIPARLRPAVGRGEVHISTGQRELTSAKILAFQTLAEWKARLLKLDRMDVLKLETGSPLLAGGGFLSLDVAAQAIGMAIPALAAEAANQSEDLHVYTDGWHCAVVPDIRQVERDFDGSLLLNDALDRGDEQRLSHQHLIWPDARTVAAQLAETGTASECYFYFDNQRRRAAFLDFPGVEVTAAKVLIHKAALERIRTALLTHLTPEMRQSAREALSRPVTAQQGHKYAAMKASELVTAFVNAKVEGGRWKPDQQRKMETVADSFVSLMEDPTLGEIDRPLIERFRVQLRRLPADVYQFRRAHGLQMTLREVAERAESLGLSARTQTSVDRTVGYLSEMLKWAADAGYMRENPAKTVTGKHNKRVRENRQRDPFTPADLAQIFGANWFATGRGRLNNAGKYRTFQPHYYWLPLLGLYTGARINELSQLYLDDVRVTDAKVWYLDFNLNGADKLDVDDPDDKSLKTINSIRSVPLHSEVLKLGFLEYVQALRAANHKRLFPELLHDRMKGYGKAAGSWFNDRYLGRSLGIKRDGRKVFHSFRHTFVTSLFDAELPDATVSQLSGHAQEGSMAATRYRKDQAPDKLQPYVERLKFPLPEIAPFDVGAGLDALKDALGRKKGS